MKNRNLIKKILKEELKNKTHNDSKEDISIGLLYNAMQDLISAVRNIESAAQYLDDPKFKKEMENFKRVLLSDFGTDNGVEKDNYDGPDHLINRLSKFINDHSQNNDNFDFNNYKNINR